MSAAQEIKQKLDIVSVVQDYLPLKKAGASLRANCPFHQEKTPSFYVSEARQTFHCFGCNEGGDIFAFVMRLEGLDFVGALKLLAKKAGVELKRENAEASNERDRLIAANDLAAKFFHEVLLRSPAAAEARAYAAKRQLSDATLEEFSLGYAPESWDALLTVLRKRGYHDQDIAKAGLAAKKDGGSYYDRFRNRLMFPIRDAFGNVIAFTGRVMPVAGRDPEGTAKYVNSPETPVYRKGAVLFGLDRAKREIKAKEFAVIVEGNMDVIASHQAGVHNVVASSGTALTGEQLALLKRYAKRVVFSFDHDAAGEAAARRAVDIAVVAGFPVRMLVLPPEAGKDPDDCIRKDPALWIKAISEAVPYMEWYIALVRARTDFNDADAKREASVGLMAEIAKMSDPVEQAHWVHELSQLFATPEPMLFEKLAALRRSALQAPRQPAAALPVVETNPTSVAKPDNREALLSQNVLGMLAAWPDMAKTVAADLDSSLFSAGDRDLYTSEEGRYTAHDYGVLSPQDASAGPEHTASPGRLDLLALRAERDFGELEPPARLASLRAFLGELKSLRTRRRQRELMSAMADAEKSGDALAISRITEELKGLIGAS